MICTHTFMACVVTTERPPLPCRAMKSPCWPQIREWTLCCTRRLLPLNITLLECVIRCNTIDDENRNEDLIFSFLKSLQTVEIHIYIITQRFMHPHTRRPKFAKSFLLFLPLPLFSSRRLVEGEPESLSVVNPFPSEAREHLFLLVAAVHRSRHTASRERASERRDSEIDRTSAALSLPALLSHVTKIGKRKQRPAIFNKKNAKGGSW
jgi:hypothetical protein